MSRVLIIEDNPSNLELMTYLLTHFGHEVFSATDGDAGLSMVQKKEVDVIICDLQLPTIDGYEVARRLKQHPALRITPLIAVTAYAMVGDRDRALAAGFDSYLSKPIAPELFVSQVEAVIRQGR